MNIFFAIKEKPAINELITLAGWISNGKNYKILQNAMSSVAKCNPLRQFPNYPVWGPQQFRKLGRLATTYCTTARLTRAFKHSLIVMFTWMYQRCWHSLSASQCGEIWEWNTVGNTKPWYVSVSQYGSLDGYTLKELHYVRNYNQN